MRGRTRRSNRSIIRKLGMLVCAVSIVGTLAGVANSQTADVAFCFFNVTNSTNGGDVGACVQGATDCLRGCLANCRASKTTLNAQCVQNCVNVFSFFRDVCIGNSLNTTTIYP